MVGYLPSERRNSHATIHLLMAPGTGELQAHASFQVLAVENAAGDFLDAALGRVQMRNAGASKQRQRRAQFRLHLLERSIAAVRAALMADLLQAIRADGQSVEPGAVWRQRSGQ